MTTLNVVESPSGFVAHIGLDWAERKHFWSMRTADGKRTRGHLDHTPEAIEVWAVELAQRFPGQAIALALEQSRGSLVGILSKYAHLHLFPLHPNNLANYRKSVCPSGAKGDPSDADLILDFLVKHPERLRALEPDTVETRTLQFLVEERRRLVDQHTRELQLLTHWLKLVFPQMLQWFDDVSTPLVAALLQRWPGLPQLKRATAKTLRTFFQQHNCRSTERIQQRIDEIAQAVPATTDAALLKIGHLRIPISLRALALLRDAIAGFDLEIQAVYESHPDRFIAESLPGAGPALEPRLIAALGSKRERFDSACNMASCFGIAPVTQSSGNSRSVQWRWACSTFLRQTFHEWAGCSIRSCAWAREHYDRQRHKGNRHHAAIRSVAYKWLRILFRCWKDRVAYSEQRYLAALAKASGAVVPAIAAAVAPPVEWKSCGGFSTLIEVSS